MSFPLLVAVAPRYDPVAPTRILVAASSIPYRPHNGLYRTGDYGLSWARHLFPYDTVVQSCNTPDQFYLKFVASPLDPNRLYLINYCYYDISIASSSHGRMFASSDAGVSWQMIGKNEWWNLVGINKFYEDTLKLYYYLLSEILAAFLYAQLEAHQQIQAKRRQVWEYYYTHLQDWAQNQGVQLPFVPVHCDQPYHLFYMILPSLDRRQQLIAHLKARGIKAVFHFLPLHLSPMSQRWNYQLGDCPVTESVSDRLLRLPFYNDLTEQDQQRVIEAIYEARLG